MSIKNQRSAPPGVLLPIPGTPAGDARRLAFAARIAARIANPTRIWLPLSGETTTSTTVDSNKATVTYSTSLATWATTPSNLGSGKVLTFDGTNDYATMPDAADLSFGNATLDAPFSMGIFCKPADVASKALLAKWKDTATADREYLLWIDAAKKLAGELYDESASARISRIYNTALTLGTARMLLGMSYDGRRANGGINLWKDAVQVADTANDTGSYTAMEAGAQKFQIGVINPTFTLPFQGEGYYAFICAGELHLDTWRGILLDTDDFYGTTLSA